MKLIADSGSTKTDWCLVGDDGLRTFFTTEGLNPFFVDQTYIEASIKKGFPLGADQTKIDKVHFYGAGCQDSKTEIVQRALRSFFTQADIYAELDLLGAARGLLGNKPGFAAILGTGTNTCLYDGAEIEHKIESLGFLMGDEGSGSMMGKMLLSDFIRGRMPGPVAALFFESYGKTPEQIMDEVYTSPLPNRYCATYVKFLDLADLEPLYVSGIVQQAFTAFFKNLVSAYPDYTSYSFNCIGSVGYHFADQLRYTASEFGMSTGKIISSLIVPLTDYHSLQ